MNRSLYAPLSPGRRSIMARIEPESFHNSCAFPFQQKTSYPCISTQIARHGCHSCPCRSLTYCFSVSRLIHKTETTEGAIERTSHTNLSYSIIPCRPTNSEFLATVRHGNDTVFLFLSESFKLLVINFLRFATFPPIGGMFTLHVLTRTGSFNNHVPISYNIHSNSVIRNRPLVLVLLRGSAFDHNFIPHSGQHFYKSINSHAISS